LSLLTFIGLGLNDERGMSLQGLNLAREADCVFAEFYTSLMPRLNIGNLERLTGKRILVLERSDVEEHAEHMILEKIKGRRAAFLVPGDPMMATTHLDLRLRAEKAGIETKVVPGTSIFSGICALTGLQAYKFGRTVTLPRVETGKLPESPYDNLMTNLSVGLHTLALLDIVTERNYYMTIREGLQYIRKVEVQREEDVLGGRRLVVGVARAGADDAAVKAATVSELLDYDFGGPPHSLVVPSRLHFVEAEALKILAGADPEALKGYVST